MTSRDTKQYNILIQIGKSDPNLLLVEEFVAENFKIMWENNLCGNWGHESAVKWFCTWKLRDMINNRDITRMLSFFEGEEPHLFCFTVLHI